MLVLFVAATVPTLVFGASQLRSLRQTSQEAREGQRLRAQALATDVQEYVSVHARAVRTLARQLETVSDPTALDLQAILDRMRQEYPGIVGTFIGDSEGNSLVFSPTHDPSGNPLAGRNYAAAWYFEPLKQTRQMVYSPVIPGVVIEMRPLITMVAPILDQERNLRYYISGGLDLSRMAHLLEQHSTFPGEAILLVDGEEKLIAESGAGESEPFASFKDSIHVQRIRNGTTWVEDEATVAGYATIPDLGWGVAVITPTTALEAPWHRTLNSSVLTVALALGLGWLMAWLLARTMNEPVVALIRAARAVGLGDLSVRVPPSRQPMPAEMAELHRQFNLMIASLQEYQQALVRWNSTLEERVADRTRELKVLNETATQVTGVLELEPLMQQVASGIAELVEADVGLVLLRRPSGRVEMAGVHTGTLPWLRPTEAELQRGMGARIMATGEPEIVIDVSTRRDLFGSWTEQYPHASFCGVPIRASGEAVGVLAAIHREPGRFSDLSVELLSTLAGQVGPAVSAAWLFEEVKEQRNTLLSITNSMAEGLLLVDANDRVRFANGAAGRLLQLEQPPAWGQPLRQWFAQWPDGTVLHPTPTNGGSYADIQLPGPPRRTVAATIFPVMGEGLNYLGYGILLRDVTQERKLERDKDELIANVSHELRTPLTAILGSATTLLSLEASLEPEERLDFLQGIVEESQRLKELIESLLDMARINTGNLALQVGPVDWASVCSRAIRHARARWPEHDLQLSLAPDMPPLRGDAGRLEQVLDNLLANAARYSDPGRSIRLETVVRDHALRTSVCDEGIGIPPDELEKVFDRFYRGEAPSIRKLRGTGLGLAICRGIVESHGGRIWAERNPERGSTFHVTLPLPNPGRGGAPDEAVDSDRG
ncbi:MAG: ATP-binding protein [Bacillota bacterium]